MTSSHADTHVTLRELGLRDGLQMAGSCPSTRQKREWIRIAYDAGVRHLEVGSFLPRDRHPHFADVRELIAQIKGLDDCVSSALALNERGVDDALATALDEIVLTVSATDDHSMANIRKTTEEALDLVRYTERARRLAGCKLRLVATIPVAFGCSIAGPVGPDDVIRLACTCLEIGADAIAVADTVGYAGPRQVASLCRSLLDRIGPTPLIVHLHDTRGTGIANAHAALEEGVRILDGTMGGLGGCPFAPGATGNIAFEDLVYLCERCGYATGIDLKHLLGILPIIRDSMPDETITGTLGRVGPPAKIPWSEQ